MPTYNKYDLVCYDLTADIVGDCRILYAILLYARFKSIMRPLWYLLLELYVTGFYFAYTGVVWGL